MGSSTLPFPHLTGGNTRVLHSSSPDLYLGLTVRETEARRAEATCLMSPVSNGQSTVETSPELMLLGVCLPCLSLSLPEGGRCLHGKQMLLLAL